VRQLGDGDEQPVVVAEQHGLDDHRRRMPLRRLETAAHLVGRLQPDRDAAAGLPL
jgi:hypothetical protein